MYRVALETKELAKVNTRLVSLKNSLGFFRMFVTCRLLCFGYFGVVQSVNRLLHAVCNGFYHT